jgi:hypothetical protein
MAIDLDDQPRRSYHDFDITDTTEDPDGDNLPYHVYQHHGIGLAEVLVIGFVLFVFSWLILRLVTG